MKHSSATVEAQPFDQADVREQERRHDPSFEHFDWSSTTFQDDSKSEPLALRRMKLDADDVVPGDRRDKIAIVTTSRRA